MNRNEIINHISEVRNNLYRCETELTIRAIKHDEHLLNKEDIYPPYDPRSYLRGIESMTLIDIIELACDWKAKLKGKKSEEYLDFIHKECQELNIDTQVRELIINTIGRL